MGYQVLAEDMFSGEKKWWFHFIWAPKVTNKSKNPFVVGNGI
jgi:hypothetical protein